MIKVNGIAICPTMFPDRTSQVWKLPLDEMKNRRIYVDWEFDHEGEFMHLAQLKALLDSMGYIAYLYLPYLPYGRQDKVVNNRSTFALEPFARLLNSLNFHRVDIVDPHSEEFKLINNAIDTYPYAELDEVIKETRSRNVCFPDHGASVKYSRVYVQETKNMGIVIGSKERDQETGNIMKFKINISHISQPTLIVDDICDGGWTFCLVAKALLAAGCPEVNLFVTHGIFSKGVSPLFAAGIKRIFTPKGEFFKFHSPADTIDFTYKPFNFMKKNQGDRNERISNASV